MRPRIVHANLRTGFTITTSGATAFRRSRTMHPTPSRTGRPTRFPRAASLAAACALAVAPAARAQDLEPAPAQEAEVVAEALFLCDTLPAGTRDVNLSFAFEEGEADPVTGRTEVVTYPTLQLAMPLNDRLGFTVDVGLDTQGDVRLDAPGAALKVLLREPGAGRTGLAASLDLFGSTHSVDETEVGLGLGAIRGVGPVGLRASASRATGVSGWSPHVHGGLSAAVALGGRWRALAEVIADASSDEVVIGAGPTVKLQLGEATALTAGALFEVSPAAAMPIFTLPLTRSL